jgi:hypothetical protein
MVEEIIAITPSDAYSKVFRMRTVGREGKTVEATIPREVVMREARKRGLSLQEFLDRFRVEWLYDDFGGAFARFIEG